MGRSLRKGLVIHGTCDFSLTGARHDTNTSLCSMFKHPNVIDAEYSTVNLIQLAKVNFVNWTLLPVCSSVAGCQWTSGLPVIRLDCW